MTGLTTYLYQELKLHPGDGYRIVRASNEPKILNILLQINPKHLRRLTAMQEELSMATGLAGDQRLRLGRGPAGTISLEIPKPAELTFNLTTDQLPHNPGIIGLDIYRRPARINFARPQTAHCLIAGITGSGKTNTELLIAWSLAIYHPPTDTQLILIDVEKRGRKWNQLQNSAHLAHPIIVDINEARQLLTWCVAEIDRRSRQEGDATPGLYLIIDEIQALIEAGGCLEQLTRIASIGREFNLHLIVATQYPTIEALGAATFRRNLSIRIVSRVDDASAAYIATGQKNTGAETLSGPGDSILVQPGDPHRRLTIPLLTPNDYNRLPLAADIPRLPLLDYPDPAHVLAVSSSPPPPSDSPLPEGEGLGVRVDNLDPAQIAYALATGRGITHLCQQLGIGSAKAGRLKQLADQVREEMRYLGYIIKNTGEPIQ